MGNYISYLLNTKLNTVGFKRKIEEVKEDESLDYDNVLNVPKRRKLMSTSQYIYKALYEEGRNSDVTVMALQKVWHLHKVYLMQSPYFSSMFSGNWKEANESTINIEILDDNITVEALQLALGSFYTDDLDVEASQVVPLLATAVLLQMDSVIENCKNIMKETINLKTVLQYHEAGKRYGIFEVVKVCKDWLLHNLLTVVIEHPLTLQNIPADLMQELVQSPYLYVMQTEFSIYVMLRAWLYLKLNLCWEGSHEALFSEVHKYFQNKKDSEHSVFGKERTYVSVFSSLRLIHLIYHYSDLDVISSDNILPLPWIQAAAIKQWYSMLQIEQERDKGPSSVSEKQFDEYCMRCGRILSTPGQHIWRWTGFNFGLDLVMTHNASCLKLKRNHRADGLINNHQNMRRNIMYRIAVSGLDEQKQVVYTATSGIQSISLAKNEEVKVLTLEGDVKYPLYLSANFLITTPIVNTILSEPLSSENPQDSAS